MTKKTLIVNGPSFTAGADIDYFGERQRPDVTWPRWLAEDMGWDWINIATCGASSQYISRTTMEWFAKNVEIEKKYDPKDLIVVIGWAGFNRFQTWSRAKKKFRSCHYGFLEVEGEYPEIEDYIKAKTIVDPKEIVEYTSLLDAYTMARFLESFGVEYYFMNVMECWPSKDRYLNTGIMNEYNTIYRAYGEDRIRRHFAFHDVEQLPMQCLKHIPESVNSRPGHYHWDERGHKVYKDIFKEWMQNVKKGVS